VVGEGEEGAVESQKILEAEGAVLAEEQTTEIKK
jgi:hypothetical protein